MTTRPDTLHGDLYETGDLHRLLIDSVEDYAIFALDPDGNILTWNAGAERIKGYTSGEAIGRHFSMFYPPEKIAERFPEMELREAARVGRFEDEGWRLRKDGSRFWANVVLTALHDPSGRIVGFAKVTRDLSERREAEDALRTSEERSRLLIESVKDHAIFMLDPTGIIATWNAGAQRIKNYTAAEIVGKHFSVFYLPEDIADGKPERELETAARAGVYEEEGWRVRKDGSRFWASIVITPVRRSNGDLAGFAKVTRDLTERRAAQERAIAAAGRAAAEEAARRIADATRERSDRLQHVTAALSAAHTIQEIARVVVHEGFAAAGVVAGSLAVVDDTGDTMTVVTSAALGSEPKSAGADEVTVLQLIAHGKVIGALSMHQAPGAELTDDALEFMRALAQQTAQALDRAALYEAEQSARTRADDANRVKSEFLAAMSHELRTPLNAIAGYADLLEIGVRGAVNAEQIEYLRRIKHSQQHLLGIINDILNFSRIEAGRTSYEFGPVSVGAALTSVAQMIGPQATAKGIQLSVADCPPDRIAWADAAKIEQILINLLSNAVKFTARGTIALSCELNGADKVEILVADTGVGIPPEEISRVFEPFVQVGRSLTEMREGTGLGLAISRDLARAMGGDIAVESTPGRGSTFSVTLPRPG